jgi:hypothetical protein
MATSQQQSLVPTSETDFLDQDMPIRGQKYVCLSFLSPEDVIVQKQTFLVRKFLGQLSQDINGLFDGLKQKFAGDEGVQDMVRSLADRYDYLTGDDEMQSNYDVFCATHPELEREFHEQHSFQTSVRGIKVRGCYDTFPEAENRVKQIRKFDTKFHVYVAEVGCWCPWAPRPEELADQQYAETQLNTLMKGYQENIARREEMNEMRKKMFTEAATTSEHKATE